MSPSRNSSGAVSQKKEVFYLDAPRVGCDGGGGALGHPMVYLTVGADGTVDCPYCGRHYVLKPDALGTGH